MKYSKYLKTKRNPVLGLTFPASTPNPVEMKQASRVSHDRIEKSAHYQSLKRIRKLILHFERTSMIADEEARELVLKELREVYQQWQSSDWEQIKG